MLIPVSAVFYIRGIVPLLVICALACAAVLWPPKLSMTRSCWALQAVAALCIWTGLTSIWAIDRGSALTGALKLSGNMLAGALFALKANQIDEHERRRFTTMLLVGWFGTLAVIVIEVFFSGPIFKTFWGLDIRNYDNGPFWLHAGLAVLILLYWPLVLHIRRLWGSAASYAILAGLMAITLLANFRTGVIALAFGEIVRALTHVNRRVTIRSFATLFLVCVVIAPFVVNGLGSPVEAAKRLPSLPYAAQHRIAIWAFTAEHIVERPVLGWGMNASKWIPGGKDKIYLAPDLQLGESLPLHPHNATLQIWLELGLIGVTAYLALFFGLFRTIDVSDSAATMMGQLVSAVTIANVSYGIWQSWWLAVLWISVGTMCALRDPPRKLAYRSGPPEKLP